MFCKANYITLVTVPLVEILSPTRVSVTDRLDLTEDRELQVNDEGETIIDYCRPQSQDITLSQDELVPHVESPGKIINHCGPSTCHHNGDDWLYLTIVVSVPHGLLIASCHQD